MYQFIILLRAMAAIIITNAHYEGIYPISIIANGGLWGDVIFFSVSGFCLYNVQTPFLKWYGKRIVRIYPTVWIITIAYLLAGFYSVESVQGLLELLIYPTYYHFIASIVLLYIFYYIVIRMVLKNGVNRNKVLFAVLGLTLILHTVVYLTLYDRTYYHIDSVYEPMIRFLFFESMMIGALIRENSSKVTEKFNLRYLICFISVFIIYFGSKMVFSKSEGLARFQIVNQYILLIVLTFTIITVAGLEKRMKKWPRICYRCIKYLSAVTLEIYLVQYALIPRLNIGGFPLNFFIVTVGILVVAALLHFITIRVQSLLLKILSVSLDKKDVVEK